jgi:CheY-like chemotaxis protein
VLFPARPTSVRPTAPDAPPTEAGAGDALGTILLADDEPTLARNLRELLEMLGHEVLLARDGVEAIELFHAHRDTIVCALLDVTMPRKDGLEVLSEIRRFDRKLPVVLMSGYTGAELSSVLNDGNPTGFLRKPFNMEELTETLRRVRG